VYGRHTVHPGLMSRSGPRREGEVRVNVVNSVRTWLILIRNRENPTRKRESCCTYCSSLGLYPGVVNIPDIPGYSGFILLKHAEISLTFLTKRVNNDGLFLPGMWDLGLFWCGVAASSLSSGVYFRNVWEHYSRLRNMRGKRGVSSLRRVVNTSQHPGLYPPNQQHSCHSGTRTADSTRLVVNITVNDRMAERVPTMRRGSSSYCIYVGLPFVYPIVASFLPGGRE